MGGKSLLKIENHVAMHKSLTVIVIVDSVGEAEAPHCVASWRLHKSAVAADLVDQQRNECQKLH